MRRPPIFPPRLAQPSNEPIQCPHCYLYLLINQLDKHIQQCTQYPVKCARCNHMYPKQLIMEHGDMCPSVEMERVGNEETNWGNNNNNNIRNSENYRNNLIQPPPQFHPNSAPPSVLNQRLSTQSSSLSSVSNTSISSFSTTSNIVSNPSNPINNNDQFSINRVAQSVWNLFGQFKNQTANVIRHIAQVGNRSHNGSGSNGNGESDRNQTSNIISQQQPQLNNINNNNISNNNPPNPSHDFSPQQQSTIDFLSDTLPFLLQTAISMFAPRVGQTITIVNIAMQIARMLQSDGHHGGVEASNRLSKLIKLYQGARNARRQMGGQSGHHNLQQQQQQQQQIESCSICQQDFIIGQQSLRLPECNHIYHPQCLLKWLQHHRSCPLCRKQVKVDQSRVRFIN